MSSYKIYLTKSSEVASLLSKSLKNSEFENWKSTGSGMVHRDCRIPEIYHDKGYFYAILEYSSETPKYEIVMA